MLVYRHLTKAQKNLILYIEACVVDDSGLLDAKRMNVEDLARWSCSPKAASCGGDASLMVLHRGEPHAGAHLVGDSHR